MVSDMVMIVSHNTHDNHKLESCHSHEKRQFHDFSMTFWEISILQDFSMTFHDNSFFQGFPWLWEPCSCLHLRPVYFIKHLKFLTGITVIRVNLKLMNLEYLQRSKTVCHDKKKSTYSLNLNLGQSMPRSDLAIACLCQTWPKHASVRLGHSLPRSDLAKACLGQTWP